MTIDELLDPQPLTLEQAQALYPRESPLHFRAQEAVVIGHEVNEDGFAVVVALGEHGKQYWVADILAGCGVTVER
ncbi:MAG TPA: hypothetical protein VFA43_10650 [Gemmatimonadaceae bacterium]|nr:hypothetical protein [Gemmatimonadaceae bacterium]